MQALASLASYRRCCERIRETWPAFAARREERLQQQARFGTAAEKVAENILEGLFSDVLDWSIGEVNNQVGYVDLLLTRLGVKYLVVEVKRPGALAWNSVAVARALDQACGYADAQKVRAVAVSDGYMFYAADVVRGGLRDRVFVDLSSRDPQEDLWWVSVHGIYRPRTEAHQPGLDLLPKPATDEVAPAPVGEGTRLHPKYKLPAHCFAYVGDASDPHTWSLPYCLDSGAIDVRRLPKAIQAILSNYRGTKVSKIPEAAIPDVLVRLGKAAARLHRMPSQCGETAAAYEQLEAALDQLGRLTEVQP
jgi:hypothetical protein